MPSVVCPLCGSPWLAAAPVTGPDARCMQCAKPIKLVSRDFETALPEWNRESPATSGRALDPLHIKMPHVEAQFGDEEVRQWIKESKSGVRRVSVAMVAISIFAAYFGIKHRLNEDSLIILASATAAWLALGGLLIYWYRRSQAGDYQATRAAFDRRMKADLEQIEATATPKFLIGTGGTVAVATSAFARGLRFSGADKSPMIVPVVLIMAAAALALLVGCIWLLKYRFRYLRVAGAFRLYLVITCLAAFVGVMNLAGFR